MFFLSIIKQWYYFFVIYYIIDTSTLNINSLINQGSRLCYETSHVILIEFKILINKWMQKNDITECQNGQT
jgi:hypothetical protein